MSFLKFVQVQWGQVPIDYYEATVISFPDRHIVLNVTIKLINYAFVAVNL